MMRRLMVVVLLLTICLAEVAGQAGGIAGRA
jgi:hypothetical protein